MKKSLQVLAAAASLFAVHAASSPAEAGQGMRTLQVFFPPLYFIDPHPEDFYSGPYDERDYGQPPPRRRHHRVYAPDPYDTAYGDPYADPGYNDPAYDRGYYEPQVMPPRKPVKKVVKPVAKPATKVVAKPSTKPTATPSAARPLATAPAASAATATGRVTCDKASGIISGYGFSGVKAQSCSGASYRFTATRGGKSYAIAVASASGELTEVKKLP
jgi:hypothetical protein